MITKEQIITQLEAHGITDKLEIASFLAQCHHESAGFTKLSEGTKYRFGRAKIIWASRKAVIQAKQDELKAKDDDFCPQPWLFNTVYGDRMANQDNGTNDDDGYEYRGSGLIQTTGKANHLDFMNYLHRQGKQLHLTPDTIDDFIRTEAGAIESAIYFWQKNRIGVLARNDDVLAVTKKVNGGLNGKDERIELTKKYKKELGI